MGIYATSGRSVIFLKEFEMSIFMCGERVRVVETGRNIRKTYVIKKIFKSDDGLLLYLLKSETDPALRLYYESEESGLERIT